MRFLAVAIVAIYLALLMPTYLESGDGVPMFNDGAALDTSQVRGLRGDSYHAFGLCRATGLYTVDECWESVTDGEF